MAAASGLPTAQQFGTQAASLMQRAMQRAMQLADADGTKTVGEQHVKRALEELRREGD